MRNTKCAFKGLLYALVVLALMPSCEHIGSVELKGNYYSYNCGMFLNGYEYHEASTSGTPFHPLFKGINDSDKLIFEVKVRNVRSINSYDMCYLRFVFVVRSEDVEDGVLIARKNVKPLPSYNGEFSYSDEMEIPFFGAYFDNPYFYSGDYTVSDGSFRLEGIEYDTEKGIYRCKKGLFALEAVSAFGEKLDISDGYIIFE